MKVAIVTLGCPKNEVDSWIMRSHLVEAGHAIVDVEEADVVIVNTCGFIREAKEESIDTILEALEMGKRVYVAGCLYQRYPEELKKELPEVSGWISLGDVRRVAEVLSSCCSGIVRQAVLPEVRDFSNIAPVSFVYVKISEGCNNRCHYCAIPKIRGPLRSREPKDVLEEVRFWLERGAKEIVLIAQDTTSYGVDLGMRDGLLRLLEAIDGLDGDFWVRVLYMHPAGVTRRLLEFIASSSKMVNYVEVPFQHVSERVLRLMGRRGGREAVERVARWCSELGLYLRTTFLVGHPGEGDEDFEALLSFVEQVRPWRFSVFGYSKEEGTVSYEMESLSEEVVSERVSVMTELQDRIISENTEDLVGKVVRVLMDTDTAGRAFCHAPDIDGYVFVEKGCASGQWVDVLVREAVGVDVIGTPAGEGSVR